MENKQESDKKIIELKKQIEGYGKPEYPFVSKDYELNSAIPCTDFSNWIINRFQEEDFWAIKLLRWEITRGATGLVFGKTDDGNLSKEENVYFKSLCYSINYLISLELNDFFNNKKVEMAELFTLQLMTKSLPLQSIQSYIYAPNDYQYNLEFVRYVDALSCSSIIPNLDALKPYLEKSEVVKSKYLKDRNIYYEQKTSNELSLILDLTLVQNNELFNILKSLPISHRLHFWDLINSSYFENNIRVSRRENLDCWFRTIEFGHIPLASKSSLLNNNLFIPLNIPDLVLNKLKKNEIESFAKKLGIDYKKNETKTSVIKKILSIAILSDEINSIAKEKKLFMFNSLFESDLEKILKYKNQYASLLEIIFLIEFGKPFRNVTFFKDNNGSYLIYNDDKSMVPLIL